MSSRAHERSREAGAGHHRADEKHWLPVFSEWQEKRLPLLTAMRDGLANAGCEVRVDLLGTAPRTVQMLRVRCDGPSIEAAEHRLLRLVKPLDEAGADWAGGVFCLLHQRWREYAVWSGTPAEERALTDHLRGLPELPDTHFAGARFCIVCVERPILHVYARTATEIVRSLPGVQVIGPEPGGDPREWLAIDVAYQATDVARLVAFEAGLRQLGFTTCRYVLQGGTGALLTVHGGEATVEELEARLEVAFGSPRPAWAARFRPWSWDRGVVVHRHPEPLGWRLREWLDGELGIPVVGAMQCGRGEIVLTVPVAHVDRALDLLARRPADL